MTGSAPKGPASQHVTLGAGFQHTVNGVGTKPRCVGLTPVSSLLVRLCTGSCYQLLVLWQAGKDCYCHYYVGAGGET